MKRLILVTIFLAFLLINLGGYVHNTGSSLACPDWPLCHGQLMPEMKGGVLIEHSHRLLAGLVGFLTLLIVLIARKASRQILTTYSALGMVLAQGILGGITVIYRLPALISTAHLGLSMIFVCNLIYLHHCLNRPITNKSEATIKPYLLMALIMIFLQIMLGALMRHLGLGGVCGVGYENSIFCSGNLFPTSGLEQVHMLHRGLAILVGVAAIVPNFLILKRARSRIKILPVLVFMIIPLQILLGIMTVGTGFRPIITMLHLGGAAMLLFIIWKEYLNESEILSS